MKLKALCLLLTASFFSTHAAWASESLNVAVAANFSAPMEEIATAFAEKNGAQLKISVASTGAIYAQIVNGAPFDAFFSADSQTPAKLEEEGRAVPGGRFTYAVGSLVLYANDEGERSLGPESLTGDYKHLAMANPKLAPYGLAAQETLEKLNLWDKIQSKLVTGENINQAFQFVETKNAELGFVALSQIMKNGKVAKGSYWIVPQDLHSPIKQDFVILKQAENNETAQALAAFLKGPETAQILKNYGYKGARPKPGD